MRDLAAGSGIEFEDRGVRQFKGRSGEWQLSRLDVTSKGKRVASGARFSACTFNAKALSTYMGHSSITITLDRYGHLMPDRLEAGFAPGGRCSFGDPARRERLPAAIGENQPVAARCLAQAVREQL